MRLLDFVPCGGGRRGALFPEEGVDDDAVPTAALRRREEAASLTCASTGEKRRLRSGAAGSGAWRPSLGAISEDGSAVKGKSVDRRSARVAQQPAAVAAVKAPPARAKTREVSRCAPRSNGEDFSSFGLGSCESEYNNRGNWWVPPQCKKLHLWLQALCDPSLVTNSLPLLNKSFVGMPMPKAEEENWS